ncbi:Protein RRNAD1, partial [Stegodyphus mimosarum]
MGQVANAVLRAFDINHVVDIGSGQGHLSRLLALCYNLNVVTIEAKEDHVSGAMNFDQQAFSTLKRLKKHIVVKGNEEEDQTLPRHLEGLLTQKSSKECLENILKNVWCQSPSDDA